MCGIAGLAGRGQLNPEAVRAMNQAQRHRGPDGEGVWVAPGGSCILGHRRLAIIDLSAEAAQPMPLEHVVLTYNGEIYNYLELRERLRGLGHAFHTGSDTEVLLHAYLEWGIACLQHLNGMFAFALWDERSGSLFCARDRFGEKPFYYAVLPFGVFAFASESKALSLLGGVDLAINDALLAAYFLRDSTWLDASEETLLRGVRQLLPGQAMRVTPTEQGLKISGPETYWSIDLTARRPYGSEDEGEAASRLSALLQDSVRLRLRSDVPVGSCLSGGIDSSAVVSIMRRLAPEAEIATFTGRFPGSACDEGAYAALVVSASRTTAYEVAPTPERFRTDAPSLYWHAEFPIGGLSQFAQWCVFDLAREHGVIVLLDGQGSDEQLGGYGHAIVSTFLAELWCDGTWGHYLAERRAWARREPALFSWPRILLAMPAMQPVRLVARRTGGRPLLVQRTLARRDWLEGVERQRGSDPSNRHPAFATLSEHLWNLSFRTMLSSLLRFGDRLSMAHSREVRLPFCDHRVAEFCFATAPDLLVGGGEVKRVLRCAISGLVPDAIARRPKQGFVPPQEAWVAEELSGWTRELLGGCEDGLRGYLDWDRAKDLPAACAAIRRREAPALWHLLNLACWHTFAHDRMRRQAKIPVALAS